MATPRTLVLGIGNLLMGDEGVGVHAVRVLEQELASTVAQSAGSLTIVDGGTGGFHLLSYLTDYDPVILIDATMDGQPAGAVSVLEPRYASDFPRALTAHDIGLRDLIEAAVLSGPLPKIWLITVSIAELQSMQTTMTPPVEAAILEVIARVRQLLGLIGDQPPARATV
jgi:hydrogenase maturation protease